MKYGVDVAVKRADDLDKKLLLEVAQKLGRSREVGVLDIGCGGAGLASRLAEAGASVVGVDIQDFSKKFDEVRKRVGRSAEKFIFLPTDVKLLETLPTQHFDFVVVQRMIHYLRYQDALELLAKLRQNTPLKLFISVTGLESDVGRNYRDRSKPVRDRFAPIKHGDQEIFSITEPVCLYTPEEFAVLIQEAGWEIEGLWVSAFGNVKAICY